ncbi:MAG: anthranilate synthase component I family protein [Polyangiales bacterium]|nr:chorismate-binding protein [Sandaracinaceae bacterium]
MSPTVSLTLDRFRALAQEPNVTVVPVFCEVLADVVTPVVARATLADQAGGFLLESVVGGEKWARYSFVGCDPQRIVRGVADRFETVVGSTVTREDGVDPLERLRETLAEFVPPAEVEGLPRFWGGAVGYVTYDAVRRFEPKVGAALGAEDDWEFCFGIGGTLLVFDNVKQLIKVVVPAHVPAGADVDATYHAAVARLALVVERLGTPQHPRPLSLPERPSVELPASNFERPRFEDAVRRAQEYIRAGDIFQVVLSQRFRVPVAPDFDVYDVYRAMRAINPSPYMYFLRFDDVQIAGASPETLVRLEDGVVSVRPIAGTRHRGATPEEDEAIAEELLADPKERAEHVMLVDLGRNDVGRISGPGQVRVTDKMLIERYSHVMHIVSNVEGKLASGCDALDVLRATFPAGTLSGAPKVRAMQIIEELEPERRGVYGGAVGYIGFDGNMDVAIAIRTVVKKGSELLLQAGAGVVEASVPASEWQETVNKARAGLVALSVGVPPEKKA